MQCTRCGHDNIEGAPYCTQCGMPFTPSPSPGSGSDAQTHERKVVKLSSHESEPVDTPIDRPWEVRVPKRKPSDSTSAGKAGARRKPASSGKVPVIKRPAADDDFALVDDIDDIPAAQPGHAITGASIGGAAAETGSFRPVDDTKGPSAQKTGPTPRRVQRNTPPNIAIGDRGGNDKKRLGIAIAVLVVILVALAAIFFLNSGKHDKIVTFDTDGGSSIAQQEVIDGGKIDKPVNPTREDYSFDGWYLDADYSEPASFPLEVTKDMTLYAKWTPASETTPEGTTPADATNPDAPAPNGQDDANATGNQGDANASGGASGTATGSGTGDQGAGGQSGNGAASGGTAGGVPSGNSGNNGGGSAGGNGGDNGGGSNSGGGTANPNTAKVTVVTRGGQTLSGTVHLKDGYVIPDSSKKAYSIKELRALNLNNTELCIARNEPYARMGYSFRNPGLQAYFNARSWYHNKGWRGELPEDSAGYITAHNLLKIAQDSPSASKWLRLRMS